MLVESYSMASLSKIVEDLTEIYEHSKEISNLKPEIENPKYNILQGIARGTLDSITLLADYYIEEFDKGTASLKADKPTRFFLDRLYDISKEDYSGRI